MVRSTNHSLRGPSHDRVEVEELVSPREPPIPYYSLLGVLGNFVWGQQKEPLFPDVGEARAGQHTPHELKFPVPFPVCRENRDLLAMD